MLYKDMYELTLAELAQLREFFDADFATGEEGKEYIKECFTEDGYLMDPHTATCLKSYNTCSKDEIKTIIYSTAEWTKFPPVIANAITGITDAKDIDALALIAKTANLKIPAMIEELFTKPVVQSSVIEKRDIEKEILNFL